MVVNTNASFKRFLRYIYTATGTLNRLRTSPRNLSNTKTKDSARIMPTIISHANDTNMATNRYCTLVGFLIR